MSWTNEEGGGAKASVAAQQKYINTKQSEARVWSTENNQSYWHRQGMNWDVVIVSTVGGTIGTHSQKEKKKQINGAGPTLQSILQICNQ